MVRQGAARRGMRFGVRVGVIPAVFWGILFLFVAVAPFGSGPLAVLRPGLIAVAGSLAAGVLLGVVTGAAPAVAPKWLVSRGPLRGLLAAGLAGVLFQAEVAVVLRWVVGGARGGGCSA
ncbi:hypothetical protein AB0E70_34935 [Streptomyces murinus]|uniref:hypothetical protein n=2 Tax=Streptomyces TaxID=1883 RepID=UPI00117CD560|nr:hypothetical protein [Streptomyces murinus]